MAADAPNISPYDPQAEPRCIDCFYPLGGLDSRKCPECGRPFDFRDPTSFTLKPPLLFWTFWLPGLLLALGGGFGVGALLIIYGNWGAALWFALPFACGVILGYRVMLRWYMLVLFGVILLFSWVIGLMTFGMAGAYCGVVLAVIVAVPICAGIVSGLYLRLRLKRSGFSQREHLPVWLVLAFPLAYGAVEGRPLPTAGFETISTEGVIAYPAQLCWDSLMFYEDVQHKAPWLIRTGLATPVSTSGAITGVGDQRTCNYTYGRLVKQVTLYDAPTRLDFDVVEQFRVYEHDAELLSGSFQFIAVDDHTTKVILTTTYRPRLGPRFAWLPFESYAVHGLHAHVIEGIRLEAQRRSNESKDRIGTTGGIDAHHGG